MVSFERINSGKPTHMVTVFEAQEMVLSSHALMVKPLYQHLEMKQWAQANMQSINSNVLKI